MPLFRRKPDALSLTLALAEAYRSEDPGTVAQARQNLAAVSTMDMLQGLFRFGQIISPALKPEQQDVVREELAATDGGVAIKAAVERVGAALFISGQKEDLTTAVNTYFQPLLGGSNDGTRLALFNIVAALGRIAERTDMTFNWK
jgi:hypothetical protein